MDYLHIPQLISQRPKFLEELFKVFFCYSSFLGLHLGSLMLIQFKLHQFVSAILGKYLTSLNLSFLVKLD